MLHTMLSSFSFDTSPCHSRVFEQRLLLAGGGGRQLAELLFDGLGLTSIQRFSIGDRSGLLPGHVPFSQKPSVMSQKLFLLENVSGHVWQKFGFGLLTIFFSLCIVYRMLQLNWDKVRNLIAVLLIRESG